MRFNPHPASLQGERYPEIVRAVRDRVNALRGPTPRYPHERKRDHDHP